MAVCIQIAYCIPFESGTTADRKIALYNDRVQMFLKCILHQKIMRVNMVKRENIYFRQTNVWISSIVTVNFYYFLNLSFFLFYYYYYYYFIKRHYALICGFL
jgi:hypothetical protein